MSPNLLSLLLLSLGLCAWGRAVREDAAEVSSVSGRDCTLRCTAEQKPGVQYMAVRWYKELRTSPTPGSKGLVSRNLPGGATSRYESLDMAVDFQGESHDLFLPNLTCSHSGVYTCYLAAPVGEQNREGKVVLTLTDCPAEPTPAPADATVPPDFPAVKLLADTTLLFASALLLMALVIFVISYSCLKNTFREKGRTTKKEILLNAPLKPLEKKDLMLIYTLGPKATMKHICV
ncbi:CD83 antigen [Austrofundulus limnaeus]|uniref:CD83 antigen n=1 Tax=Austrofundulus limnaeus TaxID=52670 RepID=A0A2I4CJ71_AUSLI|nr:PREDICTED: CD83 antigen [Austrofundulus limnaeus]